MQIVELKVSMDCDKCEKKVQKALLNIIGVESVNVDFQQQRVTVMGYLLDAKKLTKKVRSRTGMHAEVWNNQYSTVQQVYGPLDTSLANRFGAASDYHRNNYYSKSHRGGHGTLNRNSLSRPAYDYDYGYQQNYRPPVDDGVTTMFSEDNAHACSIM